MTRHSSWRRNLARIILISGGSVAILLPAWLPNRPTVPIERGTVELLQAFLLAGAAVVMIGAMAHAGPLRVICRVIALILVAAFVGEIEDFVSGILGLPFPESWIIGIIGIWIIIDVARHGRACGEFFSKLGNHAGAGFIAAALLIIYVFNRVIGSEAFWKASLGPAFSEDIPKICKSYLELLACYLIFIGALGLSITLARRRPI